MKVYLNSSSLLSDTEKLRSSIQVRTEDQETNKRVRGQENTDLSSKELSKTSLLQRYEE